MDLSSQILLIDRFQAHAPDRVRCPQDRDHQPLVHSGKGSALVCVESDCGYLTPVTNELLIRASRPDVTTVSET